VVWREDVPICVIRAFWRREIVVVGVSLSNLFFKATKRYGHREQYKLVLRTVEKLL
jgi:hypothetical protein